MNGQNRRLLLGSCSHEPELKTLLARGQWPAAAPAELRTHVAGCRACSDLALLTTAFHAERAALSAAAQLPPPGLLWWRAQLRRRSEAMERINRPLAGAQLFALASVCITLVAFAFFIRHGVAEWTESLAASNSSHPSHFFSFLNSSHIRSSAAEWFALSWNPAYLLPAIALIVLAGSIALYMSSERS